MNIFVCDDEDIWQNRISNLLKKFDPKVHVYSTNKKEEIDTVLNNIKIDLAYLDIEMPFENGITLAKRILANNSKALIIFITSHDEYVCDAFTLHAFQYLKKPIIEEKLYSEFLRAKKFYEENNIKIRIKDRNVIYVFNVNDIIYIENYYRKVAIATTKGKFKTTKTFKTLSEELKDFDFIHPHQSYLANLHHIKSIEKYKITFRNEEQIEISTSKYADVQRHFNNYLNK